MNQSLFKMMVIVLAAISFVCCVGRNSSKNQNADEEQIGTTEEPPIVKDSIDVLIEQRAEQEFNSTIFAGLRFGSNRQTVESALKDKDKKTIRVFVGEDVRQVIIRAYDADYYNGQLASLTLYADEVSLLDALTNLYTTKYGETKERFWEYKDAEILVDSRTRSVYKAADGWNSTTLYYNSYGGRNTTAITRSSSYLAISYKSKTLLQAIQRQKAIKDSLDNVKRIQEEQRQKEKERKLAEEAVSNI